MPPFIHAKQTRNVVYIPRLAFLHLKQSAGNQNAGQRRPLTGTAYVQNLTMSLSRTCSYVLNLPWDIDLLYPWCNLLRLSGAFGACV